MNTMFSAEKKWGRSPDDATVHHRAEDRGQHSQTCTPSLHCAPATNRYRQPGQAGGTWHLCDLWFSSACQPPLKRPHLCAIGAGKAGRTSGIAGRAAFVTATFGGSSWRRRACSNGCCAGLGSGDFSGSLAHGRQVAQA